MKNLLKKIICLALAVTFVVSLAACGKKDDGKPGDGSTGDTTNKAEQVVTETEKLLVKADGTSDYAILIPSEGFTPTHQYAADEICLRVSEATGVALPIYRDGEVSIDANSNTKYISIGNTKLAKEMGIEDVTREKLTRNGFRIKSYKDAIVIVAPNPSGLLYGSYRFLENQIDYIYYAPTEIRVGDYVGKDLNLKFFNFEDWPDFLERNVFNYDTTSDPQNAARLYNNGYKATVGGGKYGEGTWWASLHDQSICLQIIDYNKYNAKHPTWYIGGPVGEASTNPQVCYTTALYTKDEYPKGGEGEWGWLDIPAEEYASADAPHGLFWTFVYNLINNYIKVETDKSFFQLGMSDNSMFCNCKTCTDDLARFGGSRSALAFRFANAVADVVEAWRQEFAPEREIYLTMFAYLSIVDPPTKTEKDKDGNTIWVPLDPSVVARDNIVVRYAPIQDFYLFPLLDEENNVASYNAMNGWKAIAKNFAVWDYRIGFNNMLAPFPQWMSNYDNIKAYYDYGYIDVFHQGCRTFGNTSFVTVDNYVRSRLLWDVTLDYEALMGEAMDAYYDEASAFMKEYLEYTTLHYMNLYREIGWKAHSHQAYIDTAHFPRGYMLNVEDIFKRAYEAIEPKKTTDPARYEKLKFRVDCESVPYRYLQLAFYTNFYTTAELEDMIAEFERIVSKAGILGMHTHGGIEDIIAGFKQALI